MRSSLQDELYGLGTMAAVQAPGEDVAKEIAEHYAEELSVATNATLQYMESVFAVWDNAGK